MRCPACGSLDDKVVDSRQAEDGQSIRRRRQCLICSGRFTTFERVEATALVVVKRSGRREQFDPTKITAGVQSAAKGRSVDEGDIDTLAIRVEEEVRLESGSEATSERVGRAVLERLYELDAVAAVRFASVYKGFDDPADFERELTLLTKRTAPKLV
ncbi:MAG TPA: transcriptional regulator NrdR [Acidimicrobiales bacterium]|nr:transcriptional regulator NrdR [Acidimicrobiales bacterium]